MKNLLTILSLAGLLALGSCAAGPQQLQRTVDDWDHQMYVKNPLLDGVLWVVPVIPIAHAGAAIGDFFVGNAYHFWFKDVWDGEGTGFEHKKVDATDGVLQSLLIDDAKWIQKK